MKKVELKLVFTDDDGSMRVTSQVVESLHNGNSLGEQRLAHNLVTELRVQIGPQQEYVHNATAWSWLTFPAEPAGIEDYFDIRNSQELWRELATLVAGAEGDLIFSRAYKALEPIEEPSIEDDLAIEGLWYIHDRKMTMLDQAVRNLVKVQELVNRLLHEGLGGDLVDTSRSDWEQFSLIRKNVIKGLQTKLAADSMSRVDLDAITRALEIPNSLPNLAITIDYRNKLMHHLRPSVDYARFYSALESRGGEDVRGPEGNIVGRRYAIFSQPSAQYTFEELADAYARYLGGIVEMLDQLSRIQILRR